jgi:2-polyprenyl-6-methoxyphenol hydroxylase-like FAD-dependent oxidoreductase
MRIAVCGGGVIGLGAAMMLARDGHDVTVLERDVSPVPESVDDSWEHWNRASVPQFRQPHNLFPGFHQVLQAELPDVLQQFIDAGGTWVDMVRGLPPFISDRAPRPGDDRFRYVTGRRAMLEYVLARAAANEPGVDVRRGVSIEGYLTAVEREARPHVTGVHTSDGDVHTDLVVDAMGRRSPTAEWIERLGGRRPIVESQDCGFTYYTRFFSGQLPTAIGPAVAQIGTFLILTLTGDNNTWSVTLWAPSGDPALKRFRDPDTFERVVRACPFYAQWLDGEPITDVLPMAGIVDRYRRFVVDSEPVATGVAAVGDAWACTNPSAGRGMSVGMLHARQLRAAVGRFDDPEQFARDWDHVTESEVAPWYWNQLAADQARRSNMIALREGRDASGVEGIVPPEYSEATRAMFHDPDVFRAVMETVGCLALPQEVFARPGLWEKVQATEGESFPMPGPNRDELLALLA